MSFLFHPNLGRFPQPDEVASGTDSDSYYGHGYRPRSTQGIPGGLTRREAVAAGGPYMGPHAVGARRHRRYLNDTLSEYESEYDTASDFDSDEDRPIVRFEWQSTFLQAGADFFDRNANAPLPDGARRRQPRRRVKMIRRKRGAAPEEIEQLEEEEEDDGLTPEQLELSQKHAHARRVRAAKFASVAGASTAATAATPSTEATDDSVDEHKADGAGTDHIAPTRNSHQRRRMAGQEAAPSLFLNIEHRLRRSLRKTATEGEEFTFLTELEEVLIAYKTGHLVTKGGRTTVSPSSAPFVSTPLHFELLSYDRTLEEEALENETLTTSDDDTVFIEHHRRHHRRKMKKSKGEEPLHLVFRSPFQRYLAHGLIEFHNLVGSSHTNAKEQRITQVKLPRAGVLLHGARLVPYLKSMNRNHRAY